MEMRRNRPIQVTDAPEHRAIPIESFDVEENSDNTLILKGYASTFQPYEMYGGPSNGYGWIEQIDRAAFERTLKEGPDLHLLINHEGLPLARTKSGTLDLSVDDHGLHVVARLDRSDPDVQRLEPKMRRKDMDEMSFAFRVKGQKWESTPEFPEDPEAYRTITEVSLHKGDVSVVNFGANPTTHAELHSVGRALAVLADCDPSELVEARANDVLLRAKAKLANVGVLNAQGADASLPAAEVKGVDGPTGTPLDGIAGIPLVGPLIESMLGLSDANKSESRADADDDVASLIAALDAALDEACSLTADVDRETLSEPVAQALDLMRGADTIVDKLMEVSGVYDPDGDMDESGRDLSAEGMEQREAVSDHAWDFPQSAYTPEQWRHACLIDSGEGDADSKSRYHLPVRDPDGTLNRNGVHAAAGRLDQVDGISDEQRTVAAKRLVALYRDQLKEDPPAHLLEMAHERSGGISVNIASYLNLENGESFSGIAARIETLESLIRQLTGVDTEERNDEESADSEEERDDAPDGMSLREALALQGIVPEGGPLSLTEAKALLA